MCPGFIDNRTMNASRTQCNPATADHSRIYNPIYNQYYANMCASRGRSTVHRLSLRLD